jgi:GTPase SAR1 family protein
VDCDKERCYWIHRSFDKEKLKSFKSDPNYYKLTDGETDVFPEKSTTLKLDNLKAKMKSTLRVDQCSELVKQISPANYFDESGCVDYLQEWERVTRDCLKKELDKQVLQSEEWKKGSLGLPVDHLEEIIHHSSVAFTKSSSFFGREELIQAATDKLFKSKGVSKGINLALIGKSGCGKTVIMSKLASSLKDQTVSTIIRFCGTSTYSLDGLKLIQSISIQLLAIYGKEAELRDLISALPSQDYKAAVVAFHNLVATYSVHLFIDSLDQLENRNEERSKLSFLRGIQHGKKSRIVVSTLPDELNDDGKPGKYFYHCEQTLKAENVSCLDTGNMDAVETTIKELLTCRQRQLTNDQWIVTLTAVSHEPTILYINLAMEVVAQWRSFDNESVLKPTVKGLINQIFDGMEKSFGREFTAVAFAMITFSREGINDHEMQDLLSLHHGVMKEVCQYSTLHCFPMHVWLRLKYVVKNLVTEKENHCIKWYHRQLWETAMERYSEKKKDCHALMGRYFANLFDKSIMKEKDIMAQPLILNNVPSLWLPGCFVNRRRVIEAYYHLMKGGLVNEATEEICSIEFVCASALCGDIFNLLFHLSELLHSLNAESIPQRLDHYFRWLKKRATQIVVYPRLESRMSAGEEPRVSFVNTDAINFYDSERKEFGITFGPLTFQPKEQFDALEMELIGHSAGVSCLSWNQEGNRIVSGSADGTVKLWDAVTGELVTTLDEVCQYVRSVAWSDDGTKIAAIKMGSNMSIQCSIKIWNSVTGELLKSLGNLDTMNSVAWNPDGEEFCITIWDVGTWESMKGTIDKSLDTKYASSYKSILSVDWNHDGSKIVSSYYNGTVNIWCGLSAKLLNSLEGHEGSVVTVKWSRVHNKILSGSEDRTIRIWDGATG